MNKEEIEIEEMFALYHLVSKDRLPSEGFEITGIEHKLEFDGYYKTENDIKKELTVVPKGAYTYFKVYVKR